MKEALENLLQSRMIDQDLKRDPLSFVHRYRDAKDQEIAGLFASQIAYGRVTLFLPVLKKFIDVCFQSKRKSLKNNLKDLLIDADFGLEHFKKRPEEITLDQYKELFKMIK